MDTAIFLAAQTNCMRGWINGPWLAINKSQRAASRLLYACEILASCRAK